MNNQENRMIREKNHNRGQQEQDEELQDKEVPEWERREPKCH